jgi:hypothetical protein
MALELRMLELEKCKQRAVEREANEGYVPHFVGVMFGVHTNDGGYFR